MPGFLLKRLKLDQLKKASKMTDFFQKMHGFRLKLRSLLWHLLNSDLD
jgi:hypothetical protein